MNKFDLTMLKRFGALAKPYWSSEEKLKARGLLTLLGLLLVGDTACNVFFNKQSGEFTSALAAGDGPRFWRSVLMFAGLLAVAVPVYSYYYYVRDRLGIEWRRWMTDRLLGKYFSHQNFYRLVSKTEIDNPDQRIAEDIAYFTLQSLNFLLLFAGAAVEILAFTKVLWEISRFLVFFLAFYAGAGTLVTFGVFGRRMVSLYFERLRREADFRFGLVRIRENAEAIALYRGEGQEEGQVKQRFGEVFRNYNLLIRWGLRLNLFSYSYSLVTLVLPSVIIAPRVLSGELEVGRVVEAAGAFSAILSALTIFVDNLEYMSRFAAGVERLDGFVQSLARPQGPELSKIAMHEGEHLRFDDVTLQTPNYERTLVRGLTVEVPQGQGLLIVGPSGCGKSSLLRAIGGLWNSGAGTLERPADLLFLPQEAYMILGNLRQQLSYPNLAHSVSDAEIVDVLERVNLRGLVERCGGFDVELDFEKGLSVGERQRLAFARVLLNHPQYVLLDEATSALDRENEELLYQTLIATSTTIVSVSHHPGLIKYHSQVLELTGDGGWQLYAAAEFRFREEMVWGT
jgi:vitamin B12/bleomycin/antimicrobial peptide transport system ATP-binding/permease protein